ncbi:MAG: glycosyltransferase [Mesorhizobium sp.]
MLAIGKPGYALAAREALTSLLRNTVFEIYVTTDRFSARLLPPSPRIHLNVIDAARPQYRADGFLAKFDALASCLGQTSAEIIFQVDADTVLLRPLSAAEVVIALGEQRMAMVEQTGIAGSGMTPGDFQQHYSKRSLAFIDESAAAPPQMSFRYFNSGVVLAFRDELLLLLEWVAARRLLLPADHSIGHHMVADQDYFQVWANTVAPDRCASLPWQWNHCSHWDTDFPRPDALIAHFSNFCNGPEFETVLAMHTLVADAPALLDSAPTGQPAGLAFIIITYNSSRVIGYCLDALPDQHEIIVIDNASSDDTLDHVTREGVTIIRNSSNEGFAAAANRGAAAATAPYLCFLNPDCLVTSAAVEAALSMLCEKPDAMIVPKYVDWHGVVVAGRQPGYSRLKLTADLLDNNGMAKWARRLRDLPGHHNQNWSWPLAAALFVRRETFRAIGGFDERYFCYMEDVAVGFEMARRGLEIVELDHVLPHLGQHGADIPTSTRTSLIDNARLQFARLHYGRVFAAALRGLRWVLRRRLDIKDALRPKRRRALKSR